MILFLTLVHSFIHLEKDLFDSYYVTGDCRNLVIRKTDFRSLLKECTV